MARTITVAALQLALNSADEAENIAAVSALVEQAGGCDILVNNAGIQPGSSIFDDDGNRLTEPHQIGTAMPVMCGLNMPLAIT